MNSLEISPENFPAALAAAGFGLVLAFGLVAAVRDYFYRKD